MGGKNTFGQILCNKSCTPTFEYGIFKYAKLKALTHKAEHWDYLITGNLFKGKEEWVYSSHCQRLSHSAWNWSLATLMEYKEKHLCTSQKLDYTLGIVKFYWPVKYA